MKEKQTSKMSIREKLEMMEQIAASNREHVRKWKAVGDSRKRESNRQRRAS